MEHLHGVFEALGEKETRAEYFKNLSSIEVVAVSCQECNRLFEKHPRLCAKRGHILKRLTIKKRFFICGNQGCSEEVSMLGSADPMRHVVGAVKSSGGLRVRVAKLLLAGRHVRRAMVSGS